ncbi:MAG: hypothetical protein H6835_09160 [Planctomycetes bacterium]|nr:hypothetical protein [Planctomycetota bacterium]
MSKLRSFVSAQWIVLALGASLAAQQTATLPPVCRTLPGNAAVSMPLRWSQGTLQVFVDSPLLPSGFVGHTITGLRLRRSTLPGDVAYPAMTRTVTVRGAFQGALAAEMIGSVTQNRPAGCQVLFGPAQVTVAATPAPGSTTTVGDEFVQIQFSTPLPVTAGTLFLEFETSDGPLQVEAGQWVDAVWFEDGADDGYVVPVGDGGCTSLSQPTRLSWTADHGPVHGTDAALRLTGAPAGGLAVAWVGLSPETRGPGAGYLGYGGSLTLIDPAMAGCHQWAPLDVLWFGTADGAGTFATTFAIPGTAPNGIRLAVQAGWVDLSRAVLPLSLSNGLQLVCNSAGVGNRCNSLFFPATVQSSPWAPFVGQMPVVILEYQ